MKSLYTLEYSQYSDKNGLYPFHIQKLEETIQANLQDFFYNNRQENQWQIIFIGELTECFEAQKKLLAQKVRLTSACTGLPTAVLSGSVR